MKSTELWQQYKDYTEEVSKKLSVLGFGAVGICWMFKQENGAFPSLIRLALITAVVYFLLDITQYFSTAIIYRIWIRKQENRLNAEGKPVIGEMPKPAWLDNAAFTAWCLKLIVLLIAYMFIGIHVLNT